MILTTGSPTRDSLSVTPRTSGNSANTLNAWNRDGLGPFAAAHVYFSVIDAKGADADEGFAQAGGRCRDGGVETVGRVRTEGGPKVELLMARRVGGWVSFWMRMRVRFWIVLMF